ncbi:hypothetical protein BKP64_13905 [Marinobacter salinus]|uniref:Uncharacterized protein n=1 Tax=Marinobacter salinus TaxID=1874317 RepID=A0A1D9GNF6_9GAMM|nr:hypothetical protein [Marinobacter salinus]AOY89173.1 hypothetical protein BKP64_13905 [Marinobacter salinus]
MPKRKTDPKENCNLLALKGFILFSGGIEQGNSKEKTNAAQSIFYYLINFRRASQQMLRCSPSRQTKINFLPFD